MSEYITAETFEAAYNSLKVLDVYDEEIFFPKRKMPPFNKNSEVLPDVLARFEASTKKILGENWVEKIQDFQLYCFYYPDLNRVHFHSLMKLKREHGGDQYQVLLPVAPEILR